MRTSTAAAPAAARITKSDPITRTSSSTTCLSESVYAACSAAKARRNATETSPSTPVSASATAASPAASASAARGDNSPRAIGRARLTGWSRSSSRSRRSLTRYAALEIAQYATKTATASSQRPASPSLVANTRPAKTSRFFSHCRGRSATNAARRGERRCGSWTISGAAAIEPGF